MGAAFRCAHPKLCLGEIVRQPVTYTLKRNQTTRAPTKAPKAFASLRNAPGSLLSVRSGPGALRAVASQVTKTESRVSFTILLFLTQAERSQPNSLPKAPRPGRLCVVVCRRSKAVRVSGWLLCPGHCLAVCSCTVDRRFCGYRSHAGLHGAPRSQRRPDGR